VSGDELGDGGRHAEAFAPSAPARRDRWPWISLLPLGLGSWAPLIAGARCGVTWWGAAGVIGPGAALTGFFIAGSSGSPAGTNQTQASIGWLLIVGSWLGGIIVSFGIRQAYDVRRGFPPTDLESPRDSGWPQPTERSRQWSANYALADYAVVFVATILLGLLLRYVYDIHVGVGAGVLIVDAMLLAGLVPVARKRGLAPADVGLRPTREMPSLGLVILGLVAYLVFAGLWVTAFIGNSTNDSAGPLAGFNHLGGFDLIVTLFAVSVSAPVIEEIFFRGLLYRSLRNRLPVWQAALVAGLLFGLVHITGYPLITLPVKAAFGVIACLLYERTGSLLPGIALHSFVDASAADLAVTGNDTFVLIIASVLITVLVVRTGFLRRLRPPLTAPTGDGP
jgi:membrane protease YdiL (CAAX protease family)